MWTGNVLGWVRNNEQHNRVGHDGASVQPGVSVEGEKGAELGGWVRKRS